VSLPGAFVGALLGGVSAYLLGGPRTLPSEPLSN
jgi:hypothetical protein